MNATISESIFVTFAACSAYHAMQAYVNQLQPTSSGQKWVCLMSSLLTWAIRGGFWILLWRVELPVGTKLLAGLLYVASGLLRLRQV